MRWRLVTAVAAVYVGTSALAWAGTNTNHEIQVYSLITSGYEELTDVVTNTSKPWKSQANTSQAQDPYYDFWTEMSCTGSECMHTTLSSRKRNADVTVANMANATTGWNTADMVVFHGHIAYIKPQWPYSGFSVWRPAGSSGGRTTWTDVALSDWSDWGTTVEPYRYHRSTISDASGSNPFIVFYAHNALTSVLIGKDYVDAPWMTENVWYAVEPSAHGPERLGQAGTDLEWIVANGCSGVPVAKPVGSSVVPLSTGASAWRKSWAGLHEVVGHYYLSTNVYLPDLGDFAASLKAGDSIRDAYFDVHTYGDPSDPAFEQPSAIAGVPAGCCYWSGSVFYCETNGCTGTYLNEAWTNLQGDPPTSDNPILVSSYKVAY